MNRRLSHDDARAVDALLDVAANRSLRQLAHPVSPARLKRVESLLSNLDALPVVAPAEGLVARTMARIDAEDAKPALDRAANGQAIRLVH